MGLLQGYVQSSLSDLLAPEAIVYLALDTAIRDSGLELVNGQTYVHDGSQRLFYNFTPHTGSLAVTTLTQYPLGVDLSEEDRAASLPGPLRLARISTAPAYEVGVNVSTSSPNPSIEIVSLGYNLLVADSPRPADRGGLLPATATISAAVILKPKNTPPFRVPILGWKIKRASPTMDDRVALLHQRAQSHFGDQATYIPQGPSVNIYFYGPSEAHKRLAFERLPGFLAGLVNI